MESFIIVTESFIIVTEKFKIAKITLNTFVPLFSKGISIVSNLSLFSICSMYRFSKDGFVAKVEREFQREDEILNGGKISKKIFKESEERDENLIKSKIE
jgi:hypothetical protein